MKTRYYVFIALLVYVTLFLFGWQFLPSGYQVGYMIFIASVAVIGSILLSVHLLHQKTNEKLESQSVEIAFHYKQIEALFSINQVIKINRPLPEFRGWAISPDFAVLVLKAYLNSRPKVILEFGSGISSVLLGYAIKQHGFGHVYTLEHDLEYAEKTRSILKQHGLDSFVTILHCELIDYTIDQNNWKWYNLEKLDSEIRVEMVVVDGPPYQVQDKSRYPALKLLDKNIVKGGTLLVDDCRRGEDMEVVKLWLKEFSHYSGDWVDTEKGAYILKKN